MYLPFGFQIFMDDSCLFQLNLDALLVKGHVDAMLKDLCEFISVVVIENVDYKILNHLADLHQTDMMCYLLDADQVRHR